VEHSGGTRDWSRRSRRARQLADQLWSVIRAELFSERGFTKTSVRDIAQTAGVSAQTVYDSIGSKQAIVARLNDLIDSEAGIGAIVGPIMATQDPQQIVTVSARITRAMLEKCGDIIRAVVSGAAAEPEIQAVLDEGHRRHLDGARTVVGALHDARAMDPSTDPGTAAENLAAITDFRFALMLQDSYGWPLDRIEEWMTTTSRRLLLA
jgi:AcrR family transcriptional regulator